jgi:sortase A
VHKDTRHNTRHPQDAGDDLLHSLLKVPVPDEDQPLRPVALRSLSEQRRQALQPFLLRTWFDHLLLRVERLLLLAVVVVFALWLFNGYGRDWLHQRGLQAAAPTTSSAPAVALADVLRAPPAESTHDLDSVALPFTPPDLNDGNDAAASAPAFLAPRGSSSPPAQIATDPRPQRLLIPTISVDTPVHEVFIENNVWQVAEYAAGYHHGSALPGETGNTVLAGHAGLRGAVFRDLGQIQVGDEVLLDAGGWRYRYQVRQLINVWPTQVDVMAATPMPVLTLITCTAWDTQRLVVIADLVDSSPL